MKETILAKTKQTGCIFTNNTTGKPGLWITSVKCFENGKDADPNIFEIKDFTDLPLDFDWSQLNIEPFFTKKGRKTIHSFFSSFCNANVWWLWFLPSGWPGQKLPKMTFNNFTSRYDT